jgi:hypothetical protein
MTYTTQLALAVSTLASVGSEVNHLTQELLKQHQRLIEQEVLTFLAQSLSPMGLLDFEHRLSTRLRELGRELVEGVCNRLEGEDPKALPSHVQVEGEEYRIIKTKMRQPVDTLFGPITLWRHLYRPVTRDSGEKSIAPLSLSLGIVENTTPALAEVAMRALAGTGATQRLVQQQLETQHGVVIGTKRLRALAERVSGRMSEARHKFQVGRLLSLLDQANRSAGGRKPVISVGRDGITLRENEHGAFEVASTATVTVIDRRGQRLGTVYLGFVPQPGQGQMSDQLTRLIKAVLSGWEGPLPRLAYVTDAGENETQYYEQVLQRMTHPRTEEKLVWQRVVDFYHAMERVWALAAALFGAKTAAANGWARKMGRLLKQPNGPFRVLHSAAAMRARQALSPAAQEEYRKAYNYLCQRTQWMQYHTYKKQHLPIGSGITEAACKMVFTQRLKLSGMRWTKAGAQTILDLRVVLLSGIWNESYRHTLNNVIVIDLPTPSPKAEISKEMAA